MQHNHTHIPKLTNINRAFKIGIAINLLYVIIEFGAGLYYNSLSLIYNTGHNLSDVASEYGTDNAYTAQTHLQKLLAISLLFL